MYIYLEQQFLSTESNVSFFEYLELYLVTFISEKKEKKRKIVSYI